MLQIVFMSGKTEHIGVNVEFMVGVMVRLVGVSLARTGRGSLAEFVGFPSG